MKLKPMFVLLLAPLALAAPATKDTSALEKVTVEQLTTLLGAEQGKSDADVARDLSGLQLSERLSAGRFARLNAAAPGEKSRQALMILADSSVLLAPPDAELFAKPTPDAAALRQMLVQVVNYVNTATHQLPNFLASRDTSAFEDRPAEDEVGEGGAGTVSLSYLPLHIVGNSSAGVTYRDGHEVTDAQKQKAGKHEDTVRGLVTAGEFGPFLSTVLADAVKGKITWGRWEQGSDGTDAVFHYQVPKEKSHYVVQFCCTREDASESFARNIYSQQSAYRGEIAFNPETGAILRITAEAELTPGELVAKAAMVVEYGQVEIAGRSIILPQKSVSLLQAHTAPPRSAMHMAIYSDMPKTFLNDTVFTDYHQFRAETRILTGDAAQP
jgi:hypothetical protein